MVVTMTTLAKPARLEPLNCFVGKIAKGALLYSNRGYVLNEPPQELVGMPYLVADIEGGLEVKVIAGGSLTVLTPYDESPLSMASILKAKGFVRRDDIEAFQPHGELEADRTRVWQKEMAAGESFKLGKWAIIAGMDPENQGIDLPPNLSPRLEALKGTDKEWYIFDILVNKPDYLVFIPKQPIAADLRDPAKPGDTYNDHFQVIYKQETETLFAFWTQASREADIDQHIAFSKSLDKGKTWTDPVILAGSPNKKNPGLLASWQQPMLAKSGRLYCLWNQQTTSRGPHCGQMFGAFSDDEGETWSAPKMVPMNERMDLDNPNPLIPPMWCNWQRPLRLGQDGKFFVGLSRHGKAPYDEKFGCKVEFLQFENIDDNPNIEDIKLTHLSTNRAALQPPSQAGKYEPAVEEAAIVKLPDGRLFTLLRSSLGSPVWSQSRDNGKTWDPVKTLKDAAGNPYKHPRSPCPIYDWKGNEAASGTYFALVHNTFNPEEKTAYQHRGPLFLIAGTFDPDGEQPIRFKEPKLFAPRKGGNSFYTSYTIVDGKGILWFPDKKFYLLGREVDSSWFE